MFGDAAAAFLIVGAEVAGFGGVPAQAAVLPADIQAQGLAPAVVSAGAVAAYGDALVASVDQAPAYQSGGVALAPVRVKEPVFGDAEVGVVAPLVGLVVGGGGVGGYFQDEVGGLALFRNGVALLPADEGAADAEGDEEVGDADAGAAGLDAPVEGHFAQDDGGFGVAEVEAEGGLDAVVVDVFGVHHIGTRGEVGECGGSKGRGNVVRSWRRGGFDGGGGGHWASRRIGVKAGVTGWRRCFSG